MALKPIAVSQLNEYISRILTTDPLLGNISVKGEISNLKYHSSGHVYFSLIDDGSKVNCFLPASYVKNIGYELGDGLEITVHGYLNVYKKGGYYTLFVKSVDVSGEGNLAAAFELLKKKLSEEGLFAPEHKKPLPEFPQKIGVVTSETGAAVKDIITTIKKRSKMSDIVIFPVPVQGQGAADFIADTIDFIDEQIDDIDLLIVGRGGGSAEDLWPFNEEVLARAIYKCKIPIISAVGHEIDFSISDFVADERAATPTAAAELAVTDDVILRGRIEDLKSQLLLNLNGRAEYSRLLADKYASAMKNTLMHRITELNHSIEKLLTLQENNPANILSKGYAIVKDSENNTITSAEGMVPGSKYKVLFKDGTAEITVSAIEREGVTN